VLNKGSWIPDHVRHDRMQNRVISVTFVVGLEVITQGMGADSLPVPDENALKICPLLSLRIVVKAISGQIS